MGRTNLAKARARALRIELRDLLEKRNKISNYLKKIKKDYDSGDNSRKERCKLILNKNNKGRTLQEWVSYYDKKISDLKSSIENLKKQEINGVSEKIQTLKKLESKSRKNKTSSDLYLNQNQIPSHKTSESAVKPALNSGVLTLSLRQEIRENIKRRNKISNYLKKLYYNYQTGRISYERYQSILNRDHRGKKLEEWVSYYEEKIFSLRYPEDHKKQKKSLEGISAEDNNGRKSVHEFFVVRKKISIKASPVLIFSAMLIIAIFLILVFGKGSFLGFSILLQEGKVGFTQEIGQGFYEPTNYSLLLLEQGELVSFKISGYVNGTGSVRVYLENYLVYEYPRQIITQEIPENNNFSNQTIKDQVNTSTNFITGLSTEESENSESSGETSYSEETAEEVSETETQEINPSQEASSEPSESLEEFEEKVEETEEIPEEPEETKKTEELEIIKNKTEEIEESKIINETEEIEEIIETNQTTTNQSEEEYSEEQINETEEVSQNETEVSPSLEEPSLPSETPEIEEPGEPEPEPEIIEEIEEAITRFIKTCNETCDLFGNNLTKESYTIRIEINDAILYLDKVDYELILLEEINVSLNETNETIEIINKTNVTISIEQYPARVGQPVRWKKIVELREEGNVTVEIPKESENITVNKIVEKNKTKEVKLDSDKEDKEEKLKEKANARIERVSSDLEKERIGITGRAVDENSGDYETNEEVVEVIIEDNSTIYEIEYETPAPEAFEKYISDNRKEIIVSGPDELNYIDVVAFTELPKEVSEEKIRLYHLVEGSLDNLKKVQIDNYDLNNNSLIDYVEWVVPHLSNQIYLLIIEAVGAEHLDENRTFISDIYDEIKSLDDIWSEEITKEHYVRVTFEQNLANENDISIYPRIINGTPQIEVYEVNETKKIAEFTQINSSEYNKIYLTNLTLPQDTFDLRIINGSLEFDHIIDPFTDNGSLYQIAYDCGTLSTANALYVMNQSVESTGTCFTISAPNITLDCNGYWINYSIGGAASTYGVYSTQFNTTVKNCNIVDGNWTGAGGTRRGIYLSGTTNATIENNFLNVSNPAGIYLSGGSFNNLTNNRVTSNSYLGIFISSPYSTLTNNIATALGGNSAIGITSDNNTLINNTGTCNSSYGIRISSHLNTLINNTGTSIGTGHGISFYIDSGNNILINNTGTSDSGRGCNIFMSDNNTLINNTGICNSSYGIFLQSSSNNTLIDNTWISNSGKSGTLATCYDTMLIGNNFYSTSNQAIYIYLTSLNTTFINNTIISNSSSVTLQFSSSPNNILINNTVTNLGLGSAISFTQSPNNTLTSNAGTSLGSGNAIYFFSSPNNNLTSNTGISNSGNGIHFYRSSNNILIKNNATAKVNYGYYVVETNYTNFTDCVYTSGSTADVYVSSESGSVENVFLNCSYDAESVNGDGNYLIRQWYFDANVTYSNGTVIPDANLTIYNSSGIAIYSELTNATGDITRQNITEYNNTGGVKYFATPHNITVTKSGYNTNSTSYNLTALNNVFANIILSETSSCGTLSSANTVYTLQNNVTSTGTCFTVSAPNITLDCNGYWINYSTSGSSNDFGINSNQFNTTIKNCNIIDGNWTSTETSRYGIYFVMNSNSTIYNSSVNSSSSTTLYFYTSKDNVLINNTIFSNSNIAIWVSEYSHNNTLINNTVKSISNRGFSSTSSNNLLLTNNKVKSNNNHGIAVYNSSNSVFLNNNASGSSSGRGIILMHSSDNVLINNTGVGDSNSGIDIEQYCNNNILINNTGISNSGVGFYAHNSSNNTITNNTGFSNSGTGAILASSSNNTFIDNNFTSNSDYGIKITSSNNNTFFRTSAIGTQAYRFESSKYTNIIDCVYTSGSTAEVYVSSESGSVENVFLNCSYDAESVNGDGNYLIRQWYFDANVTYPNGTAIPDANLTIYNSSGIAIYSELTNATGDITRQNLTEYNNTGGTKYFATPHTVNVTKTGFPLNSTTYNLTTSNNVFANIILGDMAPPTITFEEPPTPENGSSQSSSTQTIVANISDFSNITSFIDFDKSILLWLSMEGSSFDNSSFNWSTTDSGVTYSSSAGRFGQGAAGFSETEQIYVDYDLDYASHNMTISFWLYPENTATPRRQNPIGKAYGGDGTFTLEPSGYINFYFGGAGGDGQPYTQDSSGGSSANGTWTHWVITRARNSTGGTTQWYKDGVASGSAFYYNSTFLPLHSTNDLEIGDDYVNPLNGSIDEIMIFNRTLSETEILALYDSQSNKFNVTFNGLEDGYHNYTIYAIDEKGYQSNSGERNFLINDSTPPTYSSVSINSTFADYVALFSVLIDDTMALDPYGGYIFSTNNTGEWENDSFILFTETPSWANVEKVLNSTIGQIVGYMWYFNDSAGFSNLTEIYTLTTRSPELFLNFESPTRENGNATKDKFIEMNVSIDSPNLDSVTWNWNGTNYSIFNDSLILYFNLDNRSSLGESDNYIVDLTGKGGNGTVHGNTTWIPNAKYHGGFSFDGSGDYLSVPDGMDNLMDNLEYWSYAAWLNVSGTGKNLLGSSAGPDMWIWVGSGSRIEYDPEYFGFSVGYTENISSTTINAIDQNQWTFVVITRNQTDIRTYKNGMFFHNLTSSNTANEDYYGDLQFGRYSTGGAYYTGYKDEIMIFNRTLSPEEIQQLYFTNLYKYNETRWILYINQSLNSTNGLDYGTYTYFASGTDTLNNYNQTEERSVTILSPDTNPPQITFENPTPSNLSYTQNNITIKANISDAYPGNTSSWIDFDRDLVGYWSMDYYNSTHIFDNSTYGSNGTFQGGLSTSSITTGRRGNALEFNGTDQQIIVQDSNIFDFPVSGTVSIWVYALSNTSMYDMPLFRGGSSTANPGYDFELGGGGWYTEIANGTATTSCYYSSNILEGWNMLTFTFDTTTNKLKCYVNGMANHPANESDITGYGGLISSHNITLGSNNFGSYRFNGSLDEVLVFNRSLSQKEVLALYNSQSNKFNATFSDLPEGQHNYTVYAIDEAGNFNSSGESNFIIDDSNPIVVINSPSNNSYISSVVKFDADVSDNSGTTYAFINDSSLMGYWTFDTTNTTGVFDTSGNNNFGVFNENGNFGEDNLTSGEFGNALEFDGIDDVVTIPLSSSLPADFVNYGEWAFSAWVWRASDAPSDSDIFMGRYHRPRITMPSNGVALEGYVNSEYTYIVTYLEALSEEWHHIVVQQSDSQNASQIWVDGFLKENESFQRIDAGAALYIISGPGSNERWKGSIDEVLIFNRSLSGDEINALYNSSSQKFNVSYNLPDLGENLFDLIAVDKAGNINSTSLLLNNDISSPNITFEEPPTPGNASTVFSSNQTIVANISDDSAGNTSSWIDFDRDLVGYWSFDYYNSTGVFDNSTYGNNGTFVGGIGTNNITKGKRGQGINFAGSGEYINFGSSPEMNWTITNATFSVSFWVNKKNISTNTVPLGQVTGGSQGWMFYGTTLNFFVYDYNDDFVSLGSELPIGNWTHIVGVSNSTHTCIYKDGLFVDCDEKGAGNYVHTTNNLLFGVYYTTQSQSFNGSLDEVLVFNRSLSQKEVLALYNSQANKFNATFSDLSEGKHNYTVYAIDEAGNFNSSGERNFIFIEDTTPPQITWENPTPDPDEVITDSFVYLNTTITDDSNLDISSWFDWNKSLVGYWSFDYYNSTGVFDNSSYDNFGEFKDGLEISNISQGVRGNALTFDGVDDYIKANNGNVLKFGNASQFTLGAWIYTRYHNWSAISAGESCAYNLCGEFIYRGNSAWSYVNYGFKVVNDSAIGFSKRNVGDSIMIYPVVTSDLTNKWAHVVAVFDDNNVSYYRDGNYIGSRIVGYINDSLTGQSFAIGGTYRHFNGSIDEVMLFNRSLNADEVKVLYNNTANRLFNNFTDLPNGNYNYSAYSIDEAGNLNITDERNVSVNNPYILNDCVTISSPGYYVLQNNVSSTGTCFTIADENITLDCNDHWINYSTGGEGSTHGIFSGQFNITIKNCNIVDGNWTSPNNWRNGIYLLSMEQGLVKNNFVNVSNGRGMIISGCSYVNITRNNAYSNSSIGFNLYSSTYNNVTNNNGTSNFGSGIDITYANYTMLENNFGKSNNASYGIIHTVSSNNTLDSNIGLSNLSYGVYVGGSDDNYFKNNNATTNNGAIAFYVAASNRNILENNTAISNSSSGILIYLSSYHNLTNNIGNSNEGYGIYMNAVSNSTLNNNTGRSNLSEGIYLLNSPNNILMNNIGTSLEDSHGIFLSNTNNNTLTGNTGTSLGNGYGIYLSDSSDSVLINNTGVGNKSRAIYILSSSNITLTNNTGTSNNVGIMLYSVFNSNLNNNIAMSVSSTALYFWDSSNINITNQIARTTGSTGGTRYGVYFYRSNNTIFRDCINISGAMYDVYYSANAGSINNLFINCSFDKEYLTVAGTELIRKWYFDANVTYLNGTAIPDANLTIYNSTSNFIYSELTNATGDITRQNLTEYINTGGTREFNTPHTIQVTKTGYSTNSTNYNLTELNNVFVNIILEEEIPDTTPPQITWENPTPDPDEVITDNFVYLNTTITDDSNSDISSWFDWNKSLVGYWSFDYYNSTGVFDNSTYDVFGEFNGGLNYSNLTTGMRGNALEFDGSDDVINCGDSSNLNLVNNITLSFWIKPNELDGNNFPITRGAYQDNGWYVMAREDGTIRVRLSNETTSKDVISNADKLSINAWNYITIVMNNGNYADFYFNGSFDSRDTMEITYNGSLTQNLFIGAYSAIGNYPFNGSIDEIMVFNRSLSDDEIKALYNNTANRLFNNFIDLSEGDYNYSVYSIDSSGNLNITDERKVTTFFDTTPPQITWENPTPDPDEVITDSFVYLNTTITEDSNLDISSWFDWNKSLVGYWSFDYYNSTGIFDNSSYGNFGIFDDGLSISNITNGKRGNAFEFDGSDKYIEVKDDESLNISGNTFSIAIWVYFNNLSDTTTDNDPVFVRKIGEDDTGYQLRILSGKTLLAFYDTSSGLRYDYETKIWNSSDMNQWWHIVGIYNGTHIIHYRNGVEVDSANIGTYSVSKTSSSLYIGGYPSAASFSFVNGTMDEIMVFNRSLSDDEIKALYNNTANRLFNNFTDLSEGDYNYSVYSIDSSGNLNITDERNVSVNNPYVLTDCGTISGSGNYVLQNNVSSTGDCFIIASDNVTLDCDDHFINYSMGGAGATRGIYAFGRSNVTISNCIVIDGNLTYPNNNQYRHGIYLSSSTGNLTLSNSNVSIYGNSSVGIYIYNCSSATLDSNTGNSNSSHGISISSSSNNTLTSNIGASNSSYGIYLGSSTNNTLIGNTGNSNYSRGIVLSSSSNNTLINNTGFSIENIAIILEVSSNNILSGNNATSVSNVGLYLYSSADNNLFTNNIAFSGSSSGVGLYASSNNTFISNNVSGTYGYLISHGSNYTTISDCVYTSGTLYDVDVQSNSIENTIINCSYSLNKEYVASTAQLIRKWYFDANVTYSNGTEIPDANVSIYNSSSAFIYSELTNATGDITRQNLTEYIANSTGRFYATPHNVQVTKSGFLSNSTSYNLTALNNVFANIILGEDTPPQITWENPTPDPDEVITDDFVYLNTTITDDSNGDISSWFDWNKSLVGYWSFEYYNSTGVFDNSTYNTFGTFQGGLNYSNLTTGVRGNALEFNGVSDYINVPDLTFNITKDNYTISVWTYKPTGSGEVWNGFTGGGIGGGGGYWMYHTGGDIMYYQDYYDSTTYLWDTNIGLGDEISYDAWTHLVIQSTPVNMTHCNLTLYVNAGEHYLSVIFKNSLRPETTFQFKEVGRGGGTRYFNGSLDEIMIFNRTLSNQEILALYNNSQYRLFNNFTNLSNGDYNYSAYSIDEYGNLNITNERKVTVNASVAPQIYNVFKPFSLTLTDGPSPTFVIINFSVYDENGFSDLNHSTSSINLTKSGEPLRYNQSCSLYESSGNYANYTCNITMWWFDDDGYWIINANISDNEGNIAVNNSDTLTVNTLTGFVMSPAYLNFSVLTPGTYNQTPSNHLTLNNTGNQPITSPNVEINASDLRGEDDSVYALYAANFSASQYTGLGFIECNIGNGSAITLVNMTYTNITGLSLSKGNFTINDGTAQENIYFCLREVGWELTQQRYSTENLGAWTIRILLVALAFRRRKKKSKKFENYQIPLSIFIKELGALEILVKYLKEKLGLRYSEIGNLLNRDERTVWTAYKKANEKYKEGLPEAKDKERDIYLSLEMFKDRNFTPLEIIVRYLKEKLELRYSEIGELLNRDERNIWTIYSRIKEKPRESFETLEKRLVVSEIPSSIFIKELGVFETLVKYLKEKLGLRYSEIGVLLNRDERTVWTAYKKANEKYKEGLPEAKDKERDIYLSLEMFKDRNFTPLEIIVRYLKEKLELRYSEIGELLNRNQRNIWTIYNRIKEK